MGFIIMLLIMAFGIAFITPLLAALGIPLVIAWLMGALWIFLLIGFFWIIGVFWAAILKIFERFKRGY